MLRLIVPFILLLLTLFGGAVWLLDIQPSSTDPKIAARPPPAENAAELRDETRELEAALTPAAPSADDAPAFDIARIDPQGASVFAGRAAPGSSVTITADGQELGTVEADENGEWTFTTEQRIANADAKLALFKAPPGSAKRVAAAALPQPAEQKPGVPTAERNAPTEGAAGTPRTAGEVTSHMLKNLEGMVAEARKDEAQRATGEASAEAAPPAATTPAETGAATANAPASATAAPSGEAASTTAPPQQHAAANRADTSGWPAPTPAPSLPASTTAPPASAPPATVAATAQTLDAAPSSASPAPPATSAQPSERAIVVPVPITFVYNEATLTAEGRKAAGLLLEYLQIKRFPKVALTGHADERGTHELNMNLSRERLDTVARFLRENGFQGQMSLVPKGKTEPYLGVVRGDFSQDDLWQLDRRVELVLTR